MILHLFLSWRFRFVVAPARGEFQVFEFQFLKDCHSRITRGEAHVKECQVQEYHKHLHSGFHRIDASKALHARKLRVEDATPYTLARTPFAGIGGQLHESQVPGQTRTAWSSGPDPDSICWHTRVRSSILSKLAELTPSSQYILFYRVSTCHWRLPLG